MAPLVFFVGAASSGFGKGIALEALKQGHKVIATARNSSKISDLKDKGAVTFDLDVTHPLEELKPIVDKAQQVYGRIDILINPAGYILEGAIEEATHQETYDQFNVNVFGVINLTRAVLPHLRAQKSGTIAHFGSLGSWRGSPAAGIYCATKWAITGFTESLREEVSPFNIHVISIEPGYFRSGFLNPGARFSTQKRIEDYDDTAVGDVRRALEKTDNNQPGDVEKGCKVIVDVLAGAGKKVPVRLVLGSDAQAVIRGKCEETLRLLDEQKELSFSTDYPKGE
ncbi:hypothetical protein M409DRAFT_35599 [Zasmidium cellare ATCC 36951]|uniref:Oxidoreductase n=1 Tax=Zasmidium cellare ATCC 36951 TaxID=1080233 RepID=A0A6A6D2W5_ZASCE|nr:uncharacterized protein M409DRAFT_35599 [Zasmidium cellare ATCC 36951]KAF2172522.1 hypothetical protein M409DRAFT_35599 [Zasmidium cellare ATCC 36951]